MRAALPAQEEAALPVEEQAMVSYPSSMALATATPDARSLSEAVGLMPSSLIYSALTPSSLPSESDSYSGVQPMRRNFETSTVSATGMSAR